MGRIGATDDGAVKIELKAIVTAKITKRGLNRRMLIRLWRALQVRKELFEEGRFKIETDLITNSSQRFEGFA
ncbi:hypothetical protein LEP1GSC058_4109 [Leptospira fainei serovar Hurstbridge str. BUT 6]|uniref:Uncharacterized protein n=1 Tax=Leptospira fainei serovar Hurstbridge str. BUT 6 TaxID=1193011 RepID=S3VBT8_9LEPT|nr:hypothetical protein LEP1GSC058_4109 [Leptospira fainei serovar Hurstbridge str. BUT 6]